MISAPMAAKVVAPVLLVAAGGTAWASALGSTSADAEVPRAWIDSPAYGERRPPGDVAVKMHASAPGGVSEFELLVDGRSVGSRSAEGDDRLGLVTILWKATEGIHELGARARSSAGWSQPSATIVVQVGDAPDLPEGSATTTSVAGQPADPVDAVPPGGEIAAPGEPAAPATTRPAAAPTTATPPRVSTRPAPGPTTPPTTAPQVATTTSAPPPVAPPTITVNGPLTVKAGSAATFRAVGDPGGGQLAQTSITIFLTGSNGRPLPSDSSFTCTAMTTCEWVRTFPGVGSYKYSARITVGSTTALTPAPAKTIDVIIG